MSETNRVERPVKPPVRAYRLTMALEADTRTDMAWALRNLAHRIEAEEVTVGVWGSPSDGAIYELLADPSVTHDSYHAALRDYLNDKRFNFVVDAESPDMAVRPADNMAHSWRKKSLTS